LSIRKHFKGTICQFLAFRPPYLQNNTKEGCSYYYLYLFIVYYYQKRTRHLGRLLLGMDECWSEGSQLLLIV